MRFLIVVLCFAAGCTLQNLSPQARLSESVFQLNDAARWNQVDAAAKTVSPRYQPRFRSRRSGWGESVNVAEVELQFMQLDESKEGGTSKVAFSWTDGSGVNLYKSAVLQRWAKERGGFYLVDETIEKGHPGLFAEEQSSGGQGP